MISRRLFLGGILAAASGPAIVRAESLMRIKVPSTILPPVFNAADIDLRPGQITMLNDHYIVFLHPEWEPDLRRKGVLRKDVLYVGAAP